MQNHKLLLFFLIGLGLLTFTIIVLALLPQTKEETIPHPIIPTSIPISVQQTPKIIPLDITIAPTYAPSQGQGINIQSPVVQQSISEIKKLAPFLPYNKDLTLSNGTTVSIVIPPYDLQNNEWTLTVQIFNVDYQTTPDQPDYQNQRQSFKEAANYVFSWMQSNGVDPKKIFVSWGDKAYIQDQAQEWLQN